MIAGGMRSPWDAITRKSEEDTMFGDSHDQELLGQILGRSTSAPPLPSDTSIDIGGLGYDDGTESYLFDGSARRRRPTSRLFSGRDTAPLSSTDGSGYDYFAENENKQGRSTAPGLYSAEDFDEPLFYVGASERSDDRHSLLFESTELRRTQSAAPTFVGSSNLGPPPGLGMNSRSSESFVNDAIENSSTTMGLRRAASTGVIGGQTTSPLVIRSLGLESDDGGAVRPAPKTLMDLIQEDFPASPSPMYSPEKPGNSYGPYPSDYGSRPRSSSPPPQYNRMEPARRGYGAEQQDRVSYSQRDSLGGITHSMDRLQVNAREDYLQREYQSTGVQYAPQPQRADYMGREYTQEPTSQRSMYASAGHSSRARAPPQQAEHYYESQPVYYNDRQPRSAPPPVQAQMLPSGHAVYVNAPVYGYGTLQYHPGAQHQQQHHIVHHPQGGHPTHDYISVVPMHAGGQMAAIPSPQGAYAYWQQPEVSPPSAQPRPTVAYVAAHAGGGVPVAMARAPDSPVDQSGGRRQRVGQGRSPTEKGGRGKRGGGGGGRRSCADTHKHAAGGSLASPLLDEFRASKSRGWTMLDIKGHVLEFCQDQNGSRFIQQRLEVGDVNEKQIAISEVLPEVERLRNDVFGNYVVQKLLEFGTPEMKADLRDTLKGEMLALSLQMYGCRVVQKALEALGEEDLPRLLFEFHHNVLSCIQDQNGNHVIQKCIEVMSTKSKNALAAGDEEKARFFSEQIDFIIDDVLNNVTSLSCHPYGCRVLQRILEHCIEPKKIQALDEISNCHRPLLDDQYGNYVIQHVLQYGRHSDRQSILQIVIESGLLKLSKQKFASNVVEKLLKYGSPGQRNAVVRQMLQVVDEHTGAPMDGKVGGSSVVLLMVRDAYANYVVQTTLDVVAEGEEKQLLLEELTAHLAQLRQYTFAKHIVTKLGA